MNENENILLRDSESSNKGDLGTVLGRKIDAPSMATENSAEERTNETSDNFDSLTFVSSQGFFFQ